MEALAPLRGVPAPNSLEPSSVPLLKIVRRGFAHAVGGLLTCLASVGDAPCKRAAAYGPERFAAGTKGARKRRLQAINMSPGMEIAGSVRNGPFSSIETVACKPTKSLVSGPIDLLGGSRAGWPRKLDPKVIERIRWCEIGQ